MSRPLGFVGVAALKDLRRRSRDPLALALWAGIPLLVGALIVLAVGGGGASTRPTARVLIVDEDQSAISEMLARAMDGTGGLLETETVERTAGMARIGRGEASALLVVPAGFGQALLREKPTRLELVTNPAERILPGIVREMLEIAVDGAFYVHRILGDPLHDIVAGADAGAEPTDERVARISVEINGAIRRLQGVLFPPVFDLRTSVDETDVSGGAPDVGVLFLPGLLVMGLLFLSQGLADDLWKEHEAGTLRRSASSPRGVTALLAGKLVASAALLFVFVLVLLPIGMLYLGLPLRRLPAAWLWGSAAGVALFLLMSLIAAHATSRRLAGVLSTAVLFPLLMLGGSFFPSEVMPRWMAAAGRWTPNGWAVERLKDLLLGRADLAALASGLVAMAAAIALLFVLYAHRVRRAFVGR